VFTGGGSIQPSIRGKGKRPQGWSSERHPLQGPMVLFMVPAPLRGVMKVSDDTALLHSFLLAFCEGGFTYMFQVSLVPPPVMVGSPIQRGSMRIELMVCSTASRLAGVASHQYCLYQGIRQYPPFGTFKKSFLTQSILGKILQK
jgi:hypothetical protein